MVRAKRKLFPFSFSFSSLSSFIFLLTRLIIISRRWANSGSFRGKQSLRKSFRPFFLRDKTKMSIEKFILKYFLWISFPLMPIFLFFHLPKVGFHGPSRYFYSLNAGRPYFVAFEAENFHSKGEGDEIGKGKLRLFILKDTYLNFFSVSLCGFLWEKKKLEMEFDPKLFFGSLAPSPLNPHPDHVHCECNIMKRG